MRNTNIFLKEIILNSTVTIIERNKIDENEPIEHYANEILMETLNACATHFLKRNNLRESEQDTLTTLQNDIRNDTELTIIEKRLYSNLAKIKPIWGELFGTDRGLVYNTLVALKNWSCFTWHSRLHYTQQLHQKDHQLLLECNKVVIQKNQQLSNASQTLLQHEATGHSLTERATTQFSTIQKLRLENASLKNQLQKTQSEETVQKQPQFVLKRTSHTPTNANVSDTTFKTISL